MRLCELKPNNRVQIDAEYNDENYHRIESHRGMVYDIHEKSVDLLTEYGMIINIEESDIINITKAVLDRNVASAINVVRKYNREKKELESRLETLEKKEGKILQALLDANLISKFNIDGARNRLQKSMDSSLFHFERNGYLVDVEIGSTENSQLTFTITISNLIEHYMNEVDVDKLIRANAPDEKELLTKTFEGLGKIIEKKKSVVHMQDMDYCVSTAYRLTVKVTEQNFLDVRKKLEKALNELKI